MSITEPGQDDLPGPAGDFGAFGIGLQHIRAVLQGMIISLRLRYLPFDESGHDPSVA